MAGKPKRKAFGWVGGKAFRVGVGEVITAQRVYEAPGFEGERVTPYGQIHAPENRFTIPRDGRRVCATREEAIADFEENGRVR